MTMALANVTGKTVKRIALNRSWRAVEAYETMAKPLTHNDVILLAQHALAENAPTLTEAEKGILTAWVEPKDRLHRITIRLTAAEYLDVQNAADRTGVTVSQYIRDRIK